MNGHERWRQSLNGLVVRDFYKERRRLRNESTGRRVAQGDLVLTRVEDIDWFVREVCRVFTDKPVEELPLSQRMDLNLLLQTLLKDRV